MANLALIARNAKAKANGKPSRTSFGRGLYLITTAAGTKSWRCNYLIAGRKQVAVLGHFPEMTVTAAEDARRELRKTVEAGGNPGADRHARKAARVEADASTVRAISERWIAAASPKWSAIYKHDVPQRMARHVYPVIGDVPVSRVDGPMLRDFFLRSKTLEGHRPQAVHVRLHLQSMFDFAVADRLVTENPVRRGGQWLPARERGSEEEEPRAAVATIEAARDVLYIVESTGATPFLKLAHRLIALTAVRKMEGIEARWSEITDDGMTWTIPAARMKGRRGKRVPHVIPLSPQAADVFRAARKLAQLRDIRSEYVFPGEIRRGSVERSALNLLYATAGIAQRHSVHGWRATFSTILNERDWHDNRLVDMMLAHRKENVSGRYDRADIIEARRQLGCVWADMLLDGAPSAMAVAGIEAPASNVVALREAA